MEMHEPLSSPDWKSMYQYDPRTIGIYQIHDPRTIYIEEKVWTVMTFEPEGNVWTIGTLLVYPVKMGGVWSSGVSPNFGLRGVPGLCVRTLFHDFKDDRLMNMFDKKSRLLLRSREIYSGYMIRAVHQYYMIYTSTHSVAPVGNR